MHQLKQAFPHLDIEINGGFTTLEQAKAQLNSVDAVMIGRAAYDNPYLFARADQDFFGEATAPPTRPQVVEAMLPYLDRWTQKGIKLHSITRHMLHLFHGQPGSRVWKRHITEHSCKPNAGAQVVANALTLVTQTAEAASVHQAAVS